MKASVVIRAYNAEATIERALQSALIQEKVPPAEYEIIVVNDGSTDGTISILDRFASHERIRFIHQANQGAIAAANVGFRAAQGTYVGLLDSDDFFEKNFLQQTTEILDQDTSIDMVYTDYFEIINEDKKLVQLKDLFHTVADNTVYRRSSLEAAGYWAEDVDLFPEYDLLLRTNTLWKCVHIPQPLVTYVRRHESLTGDSVRVARALDALKQRHPLYMKVVDRIRSYSLEQ